ncbi:hypothetical protein IRP63_14850 (plasmid) [Clostridium botulinum]|uniref:hypothetical protein n=2 Tax=Clostridium botulinum TaxID=1491 RepID=UPI0004D9C7DB|nr:hypothetical protein [Clostridium botulinum]KEH99857.1 hypothetical protein Z952_p0188 [Clostridium botulinum C/D str. BKT75002]KEI05335.1 hypothetical protein Z954_0189 [Clostridium botulinum C/D str. BKT2873]KOC56948.1 hypothetical protein ADU89_01795 [Clostridium botulinum]KOC57423.1 hypothetical protein ADU90_06335 [Clostridium botulinum]MCD3238406.1 hypothetical protein [Clostridium botulinum D/C]
MVAKKSDKNKPSDTKICFCCGKEKKNIANNFYQNDIEYIHNHFSICKNCVKKIIDYKEMTSVFFILHILDKPFIQSVWNDIAKTDESPWGAYITQISSLPQYKEFKYRNSQFDECNISKIKSNNNEEHHEVTKLNDNDKRQYERFWGRGLENQDYIWLQEEFEDFITRYECDSKGMELLIKQICLQELDIEKRRANEEKVDQQLKTLQDLLGSSNLKPVQETGANAVDQNTFGTLVKKWENEKPIPEAMEEWKKADWIKKYVLVWFLGHLCKMMGVDNDYSRLYEEEVNNYTVDNPINDYPEEENIDD